MAVPTIAPPPVASDHVGKPSRVGQTPPRTPAELSRRRFTMAVVIGIGVMAVPFLYLLWDLWSGGPNPLRGVPYDNFYDLQARAMFHGHLSLPGGQMGIEAFAHDGRDYTYFGIFPSLIRMPILLVTNAFDGDLTAPSILVAWLATGLFTSLMLWRLRILMRGAALVGRIEAVCYGVFVAAIMGGSVVIFLGATPFIYNEDFAWSIPLTVGSLFAMIGVMQRPSWGRIAASFLLVLCANLDRTPTGWGCVIGAILIAGWFALGLGGDTNRRWALPMVAVGVVPFAAGCAVTYAKFGIPVGLPMADQVWAAVNAHRRYFLAANGGKAFSFKFLPSTLAAYLQPFAIRFTGLFPYVIPPGAPAPWLGGAVMDQTYPTASLTATSPLLLLLSIWGAVTAFRPKALGQIRYARIILVAAAAGTSGVLLWGYISQRYIADLMPFVIVGAAVGLIDLLRRLSGRTRRARGTALAVLTVAAIYCIVANVAISLWPVSDWTLGQAAQFVSAENALERHAAGTDRAARGAPAVLGTERAALHRQPLLRPLSLDRGHPQGCPGPADPTPHLASRRAGGRHHPHHRLHVQPTGEPPHRPRHHLHLRFGEAGHRAVSEGVPVLSGHRELGHVRPLATAPVGEDPDLLSAHPPEADRDHRSEPQPDRGLVEREEGPRPLPGRHRAGGRPPHTGRARRAESRRHHHPAQDSGAGHESVPEPAPGPLMDKR